MFRICKHSIVATDSGICGIEMPASAVVLSVAIQGSDLFFFSKEDPFEQKITRNFTVFCVGDYDPGELNLSFVGTALFDDSNLSFHVFEVID